MNKESFFVFWVIVLLLELAWMYSTVHNVHSSGDIAFVMSVIIITISIGAVGMIVLGKPRR